MQEIQLNIVKVICKKGEKMKKIIELTKMMCLIVITICFITIAININKKTNGYDVNHDGKVNAQDYVLIKNYIMERGD